MISLGLQQPYERSDAQAPLRPDPSSTATIHSLAMGRAACIVAKQPRARATLALLGDKQFLFSTSGESFLMYRRTGRFFVAMGDPIGVESEWPELINRLCNMANEVKGCPVFYQAEPEALSVYESMGLSCMKVGEEARVTLSDFTLQGSKKSRLRQTLRRAERAGGTFEIYPARSAWSLLEELRSVSDCWLENKHTREKGFSLGSFDPTYLMRCPIAVVRQEGKIVAFANVWQGNEGGELGVDLMRYSSEASESVMEYLFIKLLLWGQEQGYSQFSLGMAPLAGLDSLESKSFWNRAGATLYKHGERFYNFRGVHAYKSKFKPEWESRYLVSPGGLGVPMAIAAVGSLVAGGARGLIAR